LAFFLYQDSQSQSDEENCTLLFSVKDRAKYYNKRKKQNSEGVPNTSAINID
jgi:hypothetical protein